MKRHLLHIAFLLIITFNISKAQPACFDAVATKGCFPFTVSMIDCYGRSGVFYNYDVDKDSTTFVTATSHTYNTAGLFTVKQRVAGSGSVDDSVRVHYIEVLDKPAPIFDVNICEGLNVTVNINDMTYDQYEINFQDGSPLITQAPPVAFNHTYPDNSPRTIVVKGQYLPTLCGSSDSINITPLTALIANISKVTVNSQDNNGQVTLQFTADPMQKYFVEESTNDNISYTTINTLIGLSGIQNLVFNNHNTSSNQYCYRLIAFDDCSNTITSKEICSTTITATALNNQNQINWSAHIPGNVSTYSLYRNGLPIGAFPSAITSYTDLAVNCGVNYCYSIIADLTQTDLAGNNLQSISDDTCVTAISTNIPAAIQNLNSTINGNSASLTWNNPGGAMQYQVLRSVNNNVVFGNYATSSVNNYTDNSLTIPGNTYCYIVNYTDNCSNPSAAGPTTCPVILDVIVSSNSNNINNLSWSAYTGSWSLGSYLVEILDENNNVTATINAGSSLNYTDILTSTNLHLIRYRIKTIENSPGTNTSYSNIVELKYEGAVFLPNAFTPNGDGDNDTFVAKGKFLKDFKMTVFNRWGEVVFFSDIFGQGWDGIYKGSPANVDAYAYLIEATDFWGKNITKRGSVTLLR